MPKSMEIIEADVRDLYKGAEDLAAKVASIKEMNSSGNETTVSGKASAALIGKELRNMTGNLDTFKASLDAEVEKHASLDAEVEKHGNKEGAIAEMNASKTEMKKLQATFKESLRECSDLEEAIKKKEETVRQEEDEVAELEAKIAAKIKEMERENAEYEEKEKQLNAEKEAIEKELARKKKILEAELANLIPNYLFEGGEQSRSFSLHTFS
uniref:Myosin heavy chain n=1 Tax=Panagrolaimus sp. ES5 TaxID=591445 RepID=A0AC34FPW5_9BILA